MTNKERFRKVFTGQNVDRMPVYFFGTWSETKVRWRQEGCASVEGINCDFGPQVSGMDPDWEKGMWDCYGLASVSAFGDKEPKLLEDTQDYQITSNSLGDVVKTSKLGSSISETLTHGLLPTKESWEKYKAYLEPNDLRRHCPSEQFTHTVKQLNETDRVLPLLGGSLYGTLRGFLGIEEFSCMMYDEPELLDEILDHMVNLYIEVLTPVVKEVNFDFVYIFEDCCGADGPLYSPAIYYRFFHARYQRLISFYRNHGIPLMLVDSDGKVDALIPCFMDSGFDIIFPVENGKWNQTPEAIRRMYGKNVKMLGGVDKHVIPLGEEAIRAHLETLIPQVREGGFLPIPDHRIPPSCSYEEFLTYIRVFKEVFSGVTINE